MACSYCRAGNQWRRGTDAELVQQFARRPPGGRCSQARMFTCLLLGYILATSKVISGWVPTCDSGHSWWLHSAAPLRNQAVSTMTWYPTQSHYPDTEPTHPCTIIMMMCTWLGSDKYQFHKSLVWPDHAGSLKRNAFELQSDQVTWFWNVVTLPSYKTTVDGIMVSYLGFIVLLYWNTTQPAQWPDILNQYPDSEHTGSCGILDMPTVETIPFISIFTPLYAHINI